MAAVDNQWTDNDFEAYAKSLLSQAGRSEWTFQAIRDELEMEQHFLELEDLVEQDLMDVEAYEDELNTYAAEVETFLDFMEE